MGKAGLIGSGYQGRSSNLNASRSINFIPIVSQDDSKNVTALIGTPGLDLFKHTGADFIRGMHFFNELVYFVAGNKLYSMNQSGVVSSQLGNDLISSVGRVSMADNGTSPTGGDDLIICDGLKMYNYDVVTGTWTQIEIAGQTVCFIGGYFLANYGGGKWRTSGLYDGVTWSDLNISTADSSPDSLYSVGNIHGEAWLLGESSTEIWYQAGSGNPPFARVSGGILDFGIAAKHSLAKGNNTAFWLANKRCNEGGELFGAVMASGYSIVPISTEPINYQISKYSTVSDAWGYCYSEAGHDYYVITFPTGNATWAYDTSTGLWHERSNYSDSPYEIGRHRGNCYVYAWGKHLLGDYRDGRIYEMSQDYLDDDGEPIASVRIADSLNDKNELNNVVIHKLQVDAETGMDSINKYTDDPADADILQKQKVFVDVTANLTGTVTVTLGAANGSGSNFSGNTSDGAAGIAQILSAGISANTFDISNVSQTGSLVTFVDNNPTETVTIVDSANTSPVLSYSYYVATFATALLSWSTDGGHTWSNDYPASLGRVGEYNQRMIWRRLGSSRDRIFRLAISDPIKKVLIAAHVNADSGAS